LNYDINDYKKEKENFLINRELILIKKLHIAEIQPLQGCFSFLISTVGGKPTVIQIKLFQSFN
jgi:hypothetical protein